MKRVLFALAAGVAVAAAGPVAAQDTVKVGVLVSYSGMTSLGGQQTDAAIKLFQSKYGDAPGGHKIELIRRDTTGPNPEVAKRLVQEAVTRDKVQILIGPDFTPNTLAAAPIVTEAKVPTFVIGAATTGIVEKSPYMSRTFFATPQLCKPLADYAVKQGWKKVFTMVADFAPGHDCEKLYADELKKAGGELSGALRIPTRNPEFSSYMQRIKDAKPDGVFVFMPLGELSIGSLRALSDSGIKGSGVHIMGTGDITDEPYLDAVGDAALGVLTTGMYSTQHNSPMNKEFVKDYLAQNGAKARIGWSVIAAWDALRLVYDGLEAQKGSKFDPDKFMSFVHGRTFESPRGEMTIDKATGDVVQNIYIRRAEKVDGVIQNVEIETLPKLDFK